jgi:hypothetical protein
LLAGKLIVRRRVAKLPAAIGYVALPVISAPLPSSVLKPKLLDNQAPI